MMTMILIWGDGFIGMKEEKYVCMYCTLHADSIVYAYNVFYGPLEWNWRHNDAA